MAEELDELALLISAEARIDTAMAQLILTMQGVTDATSAQSIAVAELREARNSIRLLRVQLGPGHR